MANELKEILLVLKELQPGALAVIAFVAASWAVSKVAPYIFKAEQAKIGLKTVQEEHDAQQDQQDGKVLVSLGTAIENLSSVLNTIRAQFEAQEQRNNDRHVKSMEIMQGVKVERDQKIDAIRDDIKTVPALVIEAQQPHLSALDTSIQTAMNTLEKNVMARLDEIPAAVKATVAEVIREELSKLVTKECETDGNEQPSVGSPVGDVVTGDSGPGSTPGTVLDVQADADSQRLLEQPQNDPISSGSADRSGSSGAVDVLQAGKSQLVA